MGTFDSVYLNKIRQLEEENRQLLKLLNEVQAPPPPPPVSPMFPGGTPPSQPSIPPSGPHPFPPSLPPSDPPKMPEPAPVPPIRPRSASQGGSPPTPNRGPWWDPMYGRGGLGVPMETPYPITMPLPMKTPAPMTMPYQQPFSLNRPYNPNDDPNTTRPVKYGGGV